MYREPELPFTGEQLAGAGMRLAAESADDNKKGWSDQAFELLKEFMTMHEKFMCEEFRSYCKSRGLALPPSNRAFGGIIRRAAFGGMIYRIDFARVKNPKAHCANASVWKVNRN